MTNLSSNIEPNAQSKASGIPTLSLPPQGLSRAKDILPFLPFSSTCLWEWSKDGRFPAPIKLSPTITAWRNRDVLDWLESFNTNQPDVKED